MDWNFKQGEIKVEGAVFHLKSKRNQAKWCRRVVLVDQTVVPPRSQFDVTTKAVLRNVQINTAKTSDMWGTEIGKIKEGLHVATTLLPNRVDNLPVRLLNTSDHPVRLQKDTIISTLTPMTPAAVAKTYQQQTQPKDGPTDDDIIGEMMSKVDQSVPDNVREKLEGTLR